MRAQRDALEQELAQARQSHARALEELRSRHEGELETERARIRTLEKKLAAQVIALTVATSPAPASMPASAPAPAEK